MQPFWQNFHELQTSGTPFCCVTVVDGVGSVPGDQGSKLLVTREGLAAGTIGGGKIEAKALLQAQEMLGSGASGTQFVQWNLQTDLGMTCGGVVRLFFESFNSARWNLAVFGAGHVSQALIRALLPLDCAIFCFETRSAWLERLPQDAKLRPILTSDMPGEVAQLPPNAFVVLMTMGHATDLPILRELLHRPLPYIGVIGSKAKAGALRRTLLQEGFSPELCHRFFCPVGLPLGSNAPAEIAISIAAQLLQERDRVAMT